MRQSRTKRAILNISCELLHELVMAVCGFILPRLILSNYGSTYNGIVASVTQFIGCISLLESGVGNVTRAALYKPLEKRDCNQVSRILVAADQFMKKVALLFLIAVVIFSLLYPMLVIEDFDFLFSSSLIIIISMSMFAQYYFGMSSQMIFKADQSYYIISISNVIVTILNTGIAAIMIMSSMGIRSIKLASTFIYISQAIFYRLYAQSKYRLNWNVSADAISLKQRWDAFGHQFAYFLTTNTDIIIITLFLNVKEVSVYTVYYLVANAIKKLIKAVTTGIGSTLGNIMAREESMLLEIRYSQYELLVFILTNILFITTSIMYIPFINLYTTGVYDAQYCRYSLAILIPLAEYMGCVRYPLEQVVYAAGHFKQTKRAAYIEVAINAISSIVLVCILGIDGVIIGTFLAMSYRVICYNNYLSKNLIVRSRYYITKYFILFIISVAVCMLLKNYIFIFQPVNYLMWGIDALCCVGMVSLIVLLAAVLLYGDICRSLIESIMFRKER